MTTQAAQDVSNDALTFIVRFGRALHRFGASAPRLEHALGMLSQRLGVRGQFFSTPTSILCGFGEDGAQRVVLARAEPGEVDLEKLSLLHDLLNRIAHGPAWPDDAGQQLDRILDSPPRRGALVVLLAYAGASASSTRILAGGLREILTAAVIGLATGLLALLAARFRPLRRAFVPVAAIVAAFVACLAARWVPLSLPLTTLGGLIVLLPGLTLTIAMNELATRHLASGTARLTGAITVLLMIALGVAVGTRAGTLVAGAPHAAAVQYLATWTVAPALLVALLSFSVQLRARPADTGWVIAGGLLAWTGAQGGSLLFGPQLGVACGTFVLGIGSSLFARLLDRPTAVMQVPGLLLLVPGAIGLQGLNALVAGEVLPGLDAAVTMMLVAGALAAGSLLAGVVVLPRKPL